MRARLSLFVVVCFLGLFLLTLFFATYTLTESPRVWYDEGYSLQLAINQATHGKMELQTAPTEFVSAATVSLGFPLVFPVAFAFEQFGIGVLQARTVMVIFILALLATVLVLIGGLFRTRAALLTGLLLATFPILYGDGKDMLGEVPGLFYLFAFLVSLWRIESDTFEGVLQYLFAGFFAGLCVATKPIFLLLLPAIFIVVILYRKRIPFRWGAIATGLAVFGMLFLFWLFTQFSFSDISQTTVTHYTNPYGIAHIGRTILTNTLGLFTDSTPLQFLGLSLIWIVGICIRIRRKTRVALAEAVALAFAVLVFLAYLRTAGWYRYFFPAHLVALVFAPYSLLLIVEFVKEKWQKPALQKFFRLAPVALISLLALFQLYLLSFHSFVEGYYRSTTTATLEGYFGGLDPKASVFLYNVPEIAVFLPSQNYYQYLRPTDYIETGGDQLIVLQRGSVDFVVIPETTDPSTLDLSPIYKKNVRIDRYQVLSR